MTGRKLTARQLERLREMAKTSLESIPIARSIFEKQFKIAPEDLLVACDRALRWDAMEEETDEERRALCEDSHERCALAWKHRHV